MIEKLDEAARPASEVQVIQMPGGISGRSLQLALQALGAEPPGPLRAGNNQDRDAPQKNRNRRDRRRDGNSKDQGDNFNGKMNVR